MAALTSRVIVRGLPRLALLALAWCTLTGGVFSGCRGLFTPAIPEPPRGEPIVPDYRDPEATLRTMVKGLQAKGDGYSAWLGAFADTARDGVDYHQFFDSGDLQYYQGTCGCVAPTDWRAAQEQEFFLDFLQVYPSDERLAIFDPVEEDPDPPAQGDTQLLHRRYRVLATALDENTKEIAVGFADLTFTKVGDRWLITKWEDRVDPDVGVQPLDPDRLTLGRRRLESQ